MSGRKWVGLGRSYLQREVRVLHQKHEVLRRAAAFFVRERERLPSSVGVATYLMSLRALVLGLSRSGCYADVSATLEAAVPRMAACSSVQAIRSEGVDAAIDAARARRDIAHGSSLPAVPVGEAGE